jgi:hypothetical protein
MVTGAMVGMQADRCIEAGDASTVVERPRDSFHPREFAHRTMRFSFLNESRSMRDAFQEASTEPELFARFTRVVCKILVCTRFKGVLVGPYGRQYRRDIGGFLWTR